jgi:hypothetical protein
MCAPLLWQQCASCNVSQAFCLICGAGIFACAKMPGWKPGRRIRQRCLTYSRAHKKDSGSARQGETANTETCNYPNRLNLTQFDKQFRGSVRKIVAFIENNFS